MKDFVFVADWVLVVEWARFDGTFTSSDWATFVFIVNIVSEEFDFTKTTSIADWAFGTVFRNVFSTLDWLAPFFNTASSSISTDSFNIKLGTRNGFVSALDDFFNDHAWVVTSASSFDTFVFLSTVVFIPEFTGSVFNSTLISANVAVLWIDTFVSL